VTSPSDRVREMVKEGRVAPDEGERLLAALGQPPRPPAITFFYAPFARLATRQAIAIGLGIAAGEVGLSRIGAWYDAFLDCHISTGPLPSVALALVDQVLVWPVAATVFWLVACVFERRARLVDFVAMLGVARAPYVVLLVPIAYLSRSVGAPGSTAAIAAEAGLVAVAVAFIAWLAALLYTGFKHASGLRGPRAGVALLISIALAELVTKLAHAALFKFLGG
jgi:hypothetical protein